MGLERWAASPSTLSMVSQADIYEGYLIRHVYPHTQTWVMLSSIVSDPLSLGWGWVRSQRAPDVYRDRGTAAYFLFQVLERSSACVRWSNCTALNQCLSLLKVLFETSALRFSLFHGFEVSRWRKTAMQSTFHSFAPYCSLFFVCLAAPLEIPCHVFVEKVSELIYIRLPVTPLQHLQSRSLVYVISIVDSFLQFQKLYSWHSCKMTNIICYQ